MRTCEASLVDFAFLNATTGSTDLACVEGAMDCCFSSFSVQICDVEDLIGEIIQSMCDAFSWFSSIFHPYHTLSASLACTCPKERQIDRLEPNPDGASDSIVHTA